MQRALAASLAPLAVASACALACGGPALPFVAGDAGAAVVSCAAAGAADGLVEVALPAFAPARVALPGPGVVRFRAVDDAPHAVATGVVLGAAPLPDGRVDALVLRGGEACAAFVAVGAHPFYDALHPLDLAGVVVVAGPE